MRKLTAFMAACVLSVGMMSVSAFAEDAKTVTIQIEGNDENIYYAVVDVQGTTLTDVFKEVDEASDSFSITIEDSDYGSYITAVEGLEAGSFGGYDGWLTAVNGKMCEVGIDGVEVADGDTIALFYGDSYFVGMQLPYISSVDSVAGTITFASDDTVYDADYNATLVTNPVEGATVKLTDVASGETKEYVTDDKGQINTDGALTGDYTISIERFDEATKLTTVLRFAPDYKVSLAEDVVVGDDADASDISLTLISVIGMLSVAAFATAYIKKENYEK